METAAGAQGGGEATLDTVEDVERGSVQPIVDSAGDGPIHGQFSAEYNVAGLTEMAQLIAGLKANGHQYDKHPDGSGRRLLRHPVYIVCRDHQTGEDVEPVMGGKLTLAQIRELGAQYATYITTDEPPADGSHRCKL